MHAVQCILCMYACFLCNYCFVSHASNADVLDCKPTIQMLCKFVVDSVASSWYDVGLFLDIDDVMLDNIARSTTVTITDHCEDMLKRWLRKADRTGKKERSWETLLDAVAQSSGQIVAESIEQRVLASGSVYNACNLVNVSLCVTACMCMHNTCFCASLCSPHVNACVHYICIYVICTSRHSLCITAVLCLSHLCVVCVV